MSSINRSSTVFWCFRNLFQIRLPVSPLKTFQKVWVVACHVSLGGFPRRFPQGSNPSETPFYMAFVCRGYILHPHLSLDPGPQKSTAGTNPLKLEWISAWTLRVRTGATCRQAHRAIQPFSNMKGCDPITLPWKSKTIIKELSPGSVDYKHNGLYGKKHSKHSLWCLWTSRVEAIIRGGFYMLYSNLIRFIHIEICLLKLITLGILLMDEILHQLIGI